MSEEEKVVTMSLKEFLKSDFVKLLAGLPEDTTLGDESDAQTEQE